MWCPNSQAHRCAAQAGPQAPAAVHMQPGWRTRGEGWSGGLNDRAGGGSCGCGQGALVLGVLWWLSEVAASKAATGAAMCWMPDEAFTYLLIVLLLIKSLESDIGVKT